MGYPCLFRSPIGTEMCDICNGQIHAGKYARFKQDNMPLMVKRREIMVQAYRDGMLNEFPLLELCDTCWFKCKVAWQQGIVIDLTEE